MSVQVITVFAPRGMQAEWEQYPDLIRVQRKTALRFGHEHLVVTDAKNLFAEGDVLRVALHPDLMPAMIDGVIKRLCMAVHARKHLVFVDADCLVARDLEAAFTGDFDLGLTHRPNENSPINNGAMYVDMDGVSAAIRVFKAALSICQTHWAADQEAIGRAVAPVPDEDGMELRHGARVMFFSMLTHGVAPKCNGKKHASKDPFVIHFKGKDAKQWMRGYADSFILN